MREKGPEAGSSAQEPCRPAPRNPFPLTGTARATTICASVGPSVMNQIPGDEVVAKELLGKLESEISPHRGLLVAFSGGVDSGVLLAAAQRALGDRVVALTADSPSMPRRELEAAIEFARSLGVRHVLESTDEMQNEAYVRNDVSRCYWCKRTLFDAAARVAKALDCEAVAYGYTADDAGDHRPGHAAALEKGVVAPLHDAGLGKPEIRAIARFLNLQLWDKPAAPCLSSRIPYGSKVTLDKLQVIEAMERELRELGFEICRARFDGTLMRVELESDQISRAAANPIRSRLHRKAIELEIPLLAIDLEGFRSGKLNRGVIR